MRADRLVAIVLLLQTHAQMTVADLAERLEASERTIRRDLEALSFAGVPVYAQRGRGGGWRLLGGHRIDLSGLTADEALALLLATDSGTATLGPETASGLVAARRKVLVALGEPLRSQVEAAASTELVDPTRWGRRADLSSDPFGAGEGPDEIAHLGALRAAVRARRQVIVGYEPPGRAVEERRLHPHGLVCKRGVWYLVASAPAGLRTYRLSRVRAVEVTDDQAETPADFDLARSWAEIQQGLSSRVPAPVVVEVEADGFSLRRLRATVGAWWPIDAGVPDASGQTRVTLRFPNVEIAAHELVPFGEGLRVNAPEEVRAALGALGARLVARYGSPP